VLLAGTNVSDAEAGYFNSAVELGQVSWLQVELGGFHGYALTQ
jgi:hypothetical protein